MCSALALAGPATASAEWQIAPFVGQTFASSTTIVDVQQATDRAHWHFGAAASFLSEGPLGAEALFLYTPSYFRREVTAPELPAVTGSRLLALMGNVILTTPRRWNEYGLRPFVSGGLGLLHLYRDDEADALPVRLNGLGYNVGGGAIGFLSDQVGLRFELRYFRMRPKDYEFALDPIETRARLRFWTASVGVVFR